jgi:hypothetical protein
MSGTIEMHTIYIYKREILNGFSFFIINFIFILLLFITTIIIILN